MAGLKADSADHLGSPGENMRAVAVFPESQQVKIIEQEVPRLSEPDQVMLRMLDIGICIGPVGVLGAMTLAMAGFTTYVYSREVPPNPRINLVNAIGATYVSSQAAAFPDLAAQIGNIDLVYEAVGHSHFALRALQVLGTNGIFVVTGVPGLQALTRVRSGSPDAEHGAQEPDAAGHGQRRARGLRVRAARSRCLPAALAGRGPNPHRRTLSPRAGTGPDPRQAGRNQDRDRIRCTWVTAPEPRSAADQSSDPR